MPAAQDRRGASPLHPHRCKRIDRFANALCYLSLAGSAALVIASLLVIALFLCIQPTSESADAAPEEKPVAVVSLDAAAPGEEAGSAAPVAAASEEVAAADSPVATAPGETETVAVEPDSNPTRAGVRSESASATTRVAPVGYARLSLAAQAGMLLEALTIGNVEAAPPAPTMPATPSKPFSYRVIEGDSLMEIARRFGITPETVLWANDIHDPQLLFVGQKLTILPVSGVLHKVVQGDTVGAVAEMYVADPRSVRMANGLGDLAEPREGDELIVPGGMLMTPNLFEAPPSSPPSGDVLATAPRHTVAPGESLVSIADAYAVRPSAIQAANNLMNPDLVKVGQILIIPGGKNPDAAAVAPIPPMATPPSPTTATPARTPAPTPFVRTNTPLPATPSPSPASGQGDGVRYTVKKGDTLFSIATAWGVTAASLASANGITDPNSIAAGRVLVISGAKLTPAPAVAAATPVPPQPPATPVPTQPSPTPKRPQDATATPTPPPAPPAQTTSKPSGQGSAGDRVAALSQKYLGFRYVWGGHAPNGFDCTGFTWYVYREAGITIPMHDLPGQLGRGQKVEKDKLLPGDLVFFQDTYQKGLSHVGIYIGNGRFINAETEKTGVQIRALSDRYWSTRYYGASRPW